MNPRRRIGMIGYGAIARVLAATASRELPELTLVGLVRRRAGDAVGLPCPCFEDLDELLARQPTLVVECAGHEALRTLGPRVLAAGVDLLVASTGALADAATEESLRAAASRGGSRVLVVAGAIGGLDALAAARRAGLESVIYTGSKPPLAWKGTAAEQRIDLSDIVAATVIYDGNAREAALLFPQNANVAAAVALAGLGFERTRVTLLADPDGAGNLHCVEAHGAFGRFRIELAGIPLPDNPKTSRLTAGSLVAALAKPEQLIAFA